MSICVSCEQILIDRNITAPVRINCHCTKCHHPPQNVAMLSLYCFIDLQYIYKEFLKYIFDTKGNGEISSPPCCLKLIPANSLNVRT